MRLLLIEDSERLRASLAHGLRQAGYAVDAVGDGEEGLWLAEEGLHELVILDLMLPGLPGEEVLARLRRGGGRAQVLILSARDQVADRVRGLDLGADDYLVKPFSFDELLARLRALERRAYGARDPVVEVAGIRIDTVARRVWCGEQEIRLTPLQYVVLETLFRRRGRIVSRQELAEAMYELDGQAASNVTEVTICALRRKVDRLRGDRRAGGGSLISTRRGLGYVVGETEDAS